MRNIHQNHDTALAKTVLVLVFLFFTAFSVQVTASSEPTNPLIELGSQNTRQTDEWSGSFESPKGVTLELTNTAGGYSGSLGITSNNNKQQYKVQLTPVQGGLDGVFTDASGSYPLSVEKGEESGQIVIRSGGSMYELSRPGSQMANESRANTRFSHPDGLFSLSLPDDWQTRIHSSDVIEIDTGYQGAVLILLGELEPQEIGQPADRVMSAGIEVVDQLLGELEIQQIVPQGRLQSTRAGGLDAVVSKRSGNGPSGQVRIWHAMAVKGGTAYMLIAALNGNDMSQLQSTLVESFSTLQVDTQRRPAASVADRNGAGQYDQSRRSVVFNGATLDARTLGQLEAAAGQIPDGRYWYDRGSGMVGMEGGPTLAYFYANIDFCPPISPYASGGGTQVAVNGRILHPNDLAGLQMYLGYVQPGEYWLDQQGNYGYAGEPVMGNLLRQIAASQNQQTGGGGQGNDSVYTRFPNLGAGGTGVSVGGDIVNAGGVLWWPGK